jgi:hypothetical protein
MKILNLALNGIVGLGAAIFVAYFGLRHGTGLFTSLPANIAEIFTKHEGLQFVALGMVVAALIAKVFVVKALKREKTQRQTTRR